MNARFMTYEPANMLFEAALKVLNDSGFLGLDKMTQDAVLRAHKVAKENIAEREANEELVQRARDEYAIDEVEIDDHPALSIGDEGTWVSAWVWVATPDKETTP